MATTDPRRARERAGFEGAAALLERLLSGPTRAEILDQVLAARSFEDALKRLRTGLRTHTFKTSTGTIELHPTVKALDAAGRREGLHVLREWEQAAGRMSREEVPVLMLDLFAATEGPRADDRRMLGIVLDFYFLYLLALLLVRAWDEGDPNENLDRVTALLGLLQGPGGSGQRFVDHAGTLLFVATSNFHPDERGYRGLLEKVLRLDGRHRVAIAMRGAAVVGTHLRWALSAIYERDLTYMRKDNAVDYPWLFFSVDTLLREYARLRELGVGPAERRVLVGALLNGLSADPWAFIGAAPEPLADRADEHAELRRRFAEHRAELLAELEALMPDKEGYSPIALQFNFPHNTLVALVVAAFLAGEPHQTSFDALLGEPVDRSRSEPVVLLARAVTGWAAAHPERRGERRVLPVAYNEAVGLRSFSWTMGALKKETR